MKPETTSLTNVKSSRQQVDRLFTLEKITTQDIEGLNQAERNYLSETCNQMMQQLNGAAKDNFLEQIDQIMPPQTKTDIWEHNHAAISSAISRYMGQHGVMPTKNTVAQQTGLSRQTVSRHFKEYNRHPDFAAQMEQFKFMAPNMLANVYKVALGGDMRAAKLYLDMIGTTNKKQPATVVNEQNNHIQINNTILSQENLKRLTHDQLNQIESIITNDRRMGAGEGV